MRIVSYNVHACVGRDGRFLPERIADLLAPLSADFVALQEVQDRRHRDSTVSGFLARRLGMLAYPGPTLNREDAAYGNLLLARHRAVRSRPHDLSVPGREPRGAIEADFLLAGRRLRLFVTHFGLAARERAWQVSMLLPALHRDGADIRVLAGDLNEWRPAARVDRALRRVFGSAPRRKTFPARAPALALDRIFVAPRERLARLATVRSPEARVASDHLPLVMDLDVPAP